MSWKQMVCSWQHTTKQSVSRDADLWLDEQSIAGLQFSSCCFLVNTLKITVDSDLPSLLIFGKENVFCV